MLASYRILSEPHEALATMIVVAEYPNPRSFVLLGRGWVWVAGERDRASPRSDGVANLLVS